MPYIRVIQQEDAEGELLKIYNNLLKSRGQLAEVHKIQSLHPKSIVAHMDLYMCIMFGRSDLMRYQREMIAVIVSQTNDCAYCIAHHSEALMHFWQDRSKIDVLLDDFEQADIDDTDIALCHLARQLTESPNHADKERNIRILQELGMTDRGILDATLVIAYFNFVNRIVLGLGVELEADPGGYHYD